MKELPEADIYEESLAYWPYRTSLQYVLNSIAERAPEDARLLDVMCGPGHLLGKLREFRPDLVLSGVDIDERYVAHGRTALPEVAFERGDVLTWQPAEKFDFVVCTGSVHHIPYDLQDRAIQNIAAMGRPGALVIISDCYVDDYASETERKQSAAKLGYEYIRETVANGASDRVVEWTIDILWNDVLMHEFKTSFEKRLPILHRHFAQVQTVKTWPDATPPGYGDYIHVCETR